ncbi:Ig-like domain-containing protein, partial [Flavobacterium notoginsengisoli]
STRASVSVTVNATPSAPTVAAQTFCSSENKTIGDLASLGASYKWYSALTGGTALAGTTVLATGTYYVSQSSNGCESTRASVSVTVNPTPSAPTVAAQTFCSSENKTIADLASLGASYKWYSALTGGTALAGTTVLATGTYYVSQSSNGCESTRTAVVVTITTNPVKPILGSINQPTCSTFTGTFTITNYNSSYTYTISPNGATLNTATGVVTATKGIYKVTATLNSCASEISDAVEINSILCANADPFGTKTSGATATTVGNVKTNDTLNGVAVTADNTTVTPKTDGVLSVDASGVVTLAANAPSGSYSIVYQICEINTTNCKTATASVDVVNTLV